MDIPKAALAGRNWHYFKIASNGELEFFDIRHKKVYKGHISDTMSGYYVTFPSIENDLPWRVLYNESPLSREAEIAKLRYVEQIVGNARDGLFPYVRSLSDVLSVLARLDQDIWEKYNPASARMAAETPLTPEECIANAHAIPEKGYHPGAEESELELFPTKKHYSLKFQL